MLKRFLPYSLAVLLISAVALSGCGGGKSGGDGSEYTLTITVAGNGTVEPAGGRYPVGTVVTLKPKPGAGYVLSRWGGANGAQVEKNGDVYQIVMNGNKSLTAVFLYNQIVFTSYRSGNNADIHTLDLNDKTVSGALTTDLKHDRQARFSPDQNRIVFVSDRDNFGDIFVMKADGTEQTNLTNGGSCENPSWTPDGRIVYRYYDGDFEIYIMNADGSGKTRLTDNDTTDEDPVCSPDGKIAYSHRDASSYAASEIWVMNLDGSGAMRLTENNAFDGLPAWSPDGRRIAFISQRDGNSELYVMDADGGSPERLTNTSGEEWYPQWTPDGTGIIFERYISSDNYELFLLRLDDKSIEQLTDTPGYDGYDYLT